MKRNGLGWEYDDESEAIADLIFHPAPRPAPGFGRKCEFCKNDFVAESPDERFCSNKCSNGKTLSAEFEFEAEYFLARIQVKMKAGEPLSNTEIRWKAFFNRSAAYPPGWERRLPKRS